MELYSKELTKQKNHILYTLYCNPLKVQKQIAKLAGCHYATVNKIIRITHWEKYPYGTARSRMRLFYDLGYVNVPELHNISPIVGEPMFQFILDQWRAKPYATNEEIAPAGDWKLSSLRGEMNMLYRHFGYKTARGADYSPRLERLRFFAAVGWFDTERLKRDAKEQYLRLLVLQHLEDTDKI